MRPPPSAFLSATVRLPMPEPPPGLQDECDPYPPAEAHQLSASADFEANAIMVLIVLLCALICALALQVAIRCFLRGESPRSQPDEPSDPGPHKAPAPPTLSYSAGLGLAGAECAICLTEFEEGDGVRVLERCRHGFHAECIERWLCSRSSCPNCRRSCWPPPADSSSSSKSTDRIEDCIDGGDGGARWSREEEPASSSGQP